MELSTYHTELIESRILIDETTGCWNWQGSINTGGYGTIAIRRKTRTLHRLNYERLVGEIPKGICVLHKCDNPRCCNPEHLFLGTQADNIRDMHEKGRARTASTAYPQELNLWKPKREPDFRYYTPKSHKLKLSETQKSEIRQKYSTGQYQQNTLARAYGVSNTQIHNIVRGKA